MGAPTRRRVPLYCTVINTGPLVIARMPHAFVAWREIRSAVHAAMRRLHDVRTRDIHAIEGLAGAPEGDDEGDGLAACERAFAGDASSFAAFNLHVWNDADRRFDLLRAATTIKDAE